MESPEGHLLGRLRWPLAVVIMVVIYTRHYAYPFFFNRNWAYDHSPSFFSEVDFISGCILGVIATTEGFLLLTLAALIAYIVAQIPFEFIKGHNDALITSVVVFFLTGFYAFHYLANNKWVGTRCPKCKARGEKFLTQTKEGFPTTSQPVWVQDTPQSGHYEEIASTPVTYTYTCRACGHISTSSVTNRTTRRV